MDDILMDDLYTNNPKTTFVNSNENLVDGDVDSLAVDISQSNENLNFINAFEAVSKKNSDDKIKMLKKIKIDYKLSNESLNYSIESYCDTEIQSIEESYKKTKENIDKHKNDIQKKKIEKIDVSYNENRYYEQHELIPIISKIEKEKNIWIPEQLQLFYFKYNKTKFGSFDINYIPTDIKKTKYFDSLKDIIPDTSKIKPDTLEFLIPFISMGNGDYVCIYKDDSVIYYSHDGKTTFEKLNYKDLNEFCNSFIINKDWKKFEKDGKSLDNTFFK